MVEEWKLEQWQEPILKYWNQVNLYTMTRGINRFLALAKVLQRVHEDYTEIPGISKFSQWASNAPELSNVAVKAMYEKTKEKIFKKALFWSEAVNLAITDLSDELKKPFEGVKQGLQKAHTYTDVAIVSSANREAVIEEWEKFSLMDFVDICLTQTEGSKAYCIQEMLKKGYDQNHVLMVGDAPGDQKAAEKNRVLYYPILVKREQYSWQRFVEEALPRFLEETYRGTYQEKVIEEFLENLS